MNLDNFYHTYNARHLNPREVAETFIYSTNFEKLIQNNHSVILGARGCGKTTLMKMLTLPALDSWKNELASHIKANIPFYSVYISTDIYWDVKNQTYSSQLKEFGNFAEIISIFSVNSSVFKALCETFQNIISLEIKDSNEQKEIELCKHLIKAWKLSSVIPKIEYIVDALNERVDQVNQLIQHVIFNYKSEKDIVKPDFLDLSFESSLEHIIPLFERIYGIREKKKWALCFDELEFAPLWLQSKLFTSLRSRPQFMLYKLSASPILPNELEAAIKREYGATPGNDVQIIKMWSSDDNEDFSKQIICALLKKKGIQVNADEYFGSNDIYNKKPNSYEQDSEFYDIMVDLIAKDDSFKDFLHENHIPIDNPIPTVKREKDILFRKIKPIVYYRHYYIDQNSTDETGRRRVKLRSRKSGDLYSGIEVLCKICDGNPRWLIGIITSMLAKADGDRVDKKTQFSELQSAAKRFRNVISNIPIGKNSSFTLIDIIDRVGLFFNNQLLGPDFMMDPKGTFIVDDNKIDVSQNIVDLLEKGVSQGAFILLDSKDDTFDFKIRNQRFKLAYLFSLLYKLPLRKYPSLKLSECLQESQGGYQQTALF